MKLLDKIGTTVFKTPLTRKLRINGVTKAYPVYRIHIGELYYNDQNDRIATWMSEYRSKHPHAPIETLTRDSYNEVIQDFIIESNPVAINKTKVNIGLVGQRESGVVLNDGRIIDGNRRFTCIRKLHEEDSDQCWFEAAILDMDIDNDKKKIKLLELIIQHGEEQRVDYNNVDKLIGIYHDIVETKLLTVEEYARSINVTDSTIKKEIEISKLLIEFLEFINMPKKYFVAREYSVYAVLGELHTLISPIKSTELKENLKHIIFMNTIFEAIVDQKVFIRTISKMVKTSVIDRFVENEKIIFEKIEARWSENRPTDVSSLRTFVRFNSDLRDELEDCFKNAKTYSATKLTHEQPANAVEKGISAIGAIDINIIDKLSPNEKVDLKTKAEKAEQMLNIIKTKINPTQKSNITKEVILDGPKSLNAELAKTIRITPSSLDELVSFNEETIDYISTLMVKVFAYVKKPGKYSMAFYDDKFNLCSNVILTDLNKDEKGIMFSLISKASEQKELYLGIKKESDMPNSFRQLIKFKVNMSFTADFGF